MQEVGLVKKSEEGNASPSVPKSPYGVLDASGFSCKTDDSQTPAGSSHGDSNHHVYTAANNKRTKLECQTPRSRTNGIRSQTINRDIYIQKSSGKNSRADMVKGWRKIELNYSKAYFVIYSCFPFFFVFSSGLFLLLLLLILDWTNTYISACEGIA